MDNTLDQLKFLNLTEDDFRLLVDGLDALPEKGAAGEIMGDLFSAMLSKDEEQRERLQAERDKQKAKREKDKAQMKEDVKILQGKLLMLKRYFQENNILKETYEVLSIPNR